MFRTGGTWALVLGVVCAAAAARGADLVGVTSATFSWSVAGQGAPSYIVYVDRNGRGMQPVTLVHTNQVTLDGFDYGDEVAVSVVAYAWNAAGDQFSAPSPPSDPLRFVAPPVLPTSAGVLLGCASCGTLQVRSLADGRVAAEFPAFSAAWDVAATGDLDGDGAGDLLLRAHSGSALALAAIRLGPDRMPLSGAVGSIGPLGGLDARDTVALAGDLDGDGRDEALLSLPSLGAVVWSLSGSQLTPQLTPVGVVPCRAGERLLGVADFDGDGTGDLLWLDETSVSLRIARIRNRAEVASIDPGALPPLGAQASLADWDGDGDADLLWRDEASGALTLWLLDRGRLVQARALAQPPGDAPWSVVASGAVGASPAADALLQGATTGRLLLLFDPANTAASYRIPLLDPGSGWRALAVIQ